MLVEDRGVGDDASDVEAGALPATALAGAFPPIDLPVRPPYPPMEARLVASLPTGDGWLYEPKWDGFRCLAFRSGDDVLLQSKAGQPLTRYFPELVETLRALPSHRFVLDGEIVIFADGVLAFDDLLQRIHPAESRIRKLARETPVTYLAFDLLIGSWEVRDARVAVPLHVNRAEVLSFQGFLRRVGRVGRPAAGDDKQREDHRNARPFHTHLHRAIQCKSLSEP